VGIVVVGHVDLQQAEGRLGVARVQTDGRHAELAQAVPVPGAERAGLEADPHRARRPRADDVGAGLRLRGHAAAPHGGAARIEAAG
jgi:hypothetical protein